MQNKELISYLSTFVTEQRIETFKKVLEYRTRYITVVLEDIFQSHNASAVLRSADCFGIQDVHIIENKNNYNINPDVALGSTKWITMHRYNEQDHNTLACINDLKKKGYVIAATSLNQQSISINDLPLDKKTAVIFGTEKTGISNVVIDNADCFVQIPMYGFTESFNISVSAALCMHTLVSRLHKMDINWHLNDGEKEELILQWLRNTIHKSDLIEKEYLNKVSR